MLNITPIANNVNLGLDFDADLEKSQFVWRALESGQDYEIFFFDGTKTIQISDNQTNEDYAPKVSNGQVVWYQYNGSDAEIFFFDGTKTIQLTDNTANDESPQISNGQVLWYQYEALTNTEDPNDSESEIYLYNGSQTLQITNNETDERNAQFYGNQIVWEGLDPAEKGGDYEILLYDNGQTQRLTDNQRDDILEGVEGNYIFWNSVNSITNQQELFVYDGKQSLQLLAFDPPIFFDPPVFAFDDSIIPPDFKNYYDTDGQNLVWIKNNNIYLYDGNTTQQITYDGITNDGIFKYNVQVSGNKIVWLGYNFATGNGNEVFLYDGNTTTQLTNNDVYEYNLQVDGENIVWQVDNYLRYGDILVPNYDIYIYRNGAVSPLATTTQNEFIISLSGNKLLGYIDDIYNYDGKIDQIFLATWTDDTFPLLANPAQYGASYSDLIETYGYNLEAFYQHYRQFGVYEGRSSDSFDEFGYLASNPDLIRVYGADGQAATRHYIENGYTEKRPLDTFNALQYIASYNDLRAIFGGSSEPEYFLETNYAGATRHYVEYGYNEGRETDTFGELSYLAANSDLIGAFGFDLEAATKHYIQHGFSENRPLTFNASEYLAANTDLIDVLGSSRTVATQHYITSGYGENRSKYGDFDGLQYLASYTDVYAQVGVNYQAAIDHFVDYGYTEGRAKDTFDEYRYLASNLDLIPVYSDYGYVNGYGATEHYLYNGISENRPTTTFDPAEYYNANPDVAAYYNFDLTQASSHYVQYGYYEDRPTVYTYKISDNICSCVSTITIIQPPIVEIS